MVLRQPDGTLAQIPAWMCAPAAASMAVRDGPRIALTALRDLRLALDAALSSLSDTAGGERHGDWLQRGSLPKDELLAAELTGPMYSYNAANALLLEPKADMKRRGIPSPDVADAFALTFAYNVARWEEAEEPVAFEAGRSLVTGY